MSITDKLREWWVRKFPVMDKELHEDFIAIVDRIDEKHYDAQSDAYDEGAHYVFNNPTLFGLIPSPKDADGQYIHIWDRMEHIELGYVLEVIAVGVDCFIAWNTHLDRYCQYDSKLFRHHHEPTVEDVLAEFALEIDPSADIAVTGAETIN